MTIRGRWYLTATITLPLIPSTAYLLWLWPRPHTTSVAAEVLAGGFVLLGLDAAAVLCGVRGVCL